MTTSPFNGLFRKGMRRWLGGCIGVGVALFSTGLRGFAEEPPVGATGAQVEVPPQHNEAADGVASGRALRQAEFAALMSERTNMFEKVRLQMETVTAAKATAGAAGVQTATGRAYRDAVLAVEAALDAHPEIQSLQAQVDTLQKLLVEQSREMAGILDAWRVARRTVRKDYDAAVARLSQDAVKAQRELLEAENARSPGRLTPAGQQRYQDVQSALTNSLAEITATFQKASSEEGFQALRAADGSDKRFEDLSAALKQMNSQQDALKHAMQARRDALRTTSPDIVALQEQARSASHRHMAAIQARPDVAQALAWVKGADARQRDFDEQATVLYGSILSEYPDLRDELDAFARQGGLVLTEETIRVAGERTEMTRERNQ